MIYLTKQEPGLYELEARCDCPTHDGECTATARIPDTSISVVEDFWALGWETITSTPAFEGDDGSIRTYCPECALERIASL